MDKETDLVRCGPVLPLPDALPPEKGERTFASNAGRGDDISLHGLNTPIQWYYGLGHLIYDLRP